MKKLLLSIVFALFLINLHAQTTLDTAVNFSVKDVHGNSIELFEILNNGQFVLIDFFNTSCGPCIFYAPDIQAAYEDFGCNDGDVFFLGIDKGSDNAAVLAFDSIYGIQFPNVSGSNGGGNQVHKEYNIQGVPTQVLIAPDKIILNQQIWPPTQGNIDTAILNAGCVMQPCYTQLNEFENKVNHDILSINPNPAKNIINLNIKVKKIRNLSVEIYSLIGERVLKVPDKTYENGRHIINLSTANIPEGIYFVNLSEKKKVLSTTKLIVVK